MINLKWKILYLLPLCLLLLSFASPLPTFSKTIDYKFNFGEGVETYHQKIEVACEVFGCDAGKAKRIMWCESKDNQKAVNWTEPGNPRGLFQFKQRTFNWLADLSGIPNANINDADAQIYIFTKTLTSNPEIVRQHWACK